jgi:hypothetical protein
MGAPATDLETTLGAVRDAAGEAQRAVDTIIAAGDAALTLLPGVFGNELAAALTRLRRMFDEAMADLAALIAQAGSPDTLRAAGAVWAGDIGGTVSRLAGLATLNGVRADDYNKLTYFTFSGPVQLPGITLPAGTTSFGWSTRRPAAESCAW